MLIRKQRRLDRINDRFAGVKLFLYGKDDQLTPWAAQEHLQQIQTELKRWPKLLPELSFSPEELLQLQTRLNRLHQLEQRFDGGVASLSKPQTNQQLDLAIQAATVLWDELATSSNLPPLSFTHNNVGALLNELKAERQKLLATQASQPTGVPKDVLLRSAFSVPEPD